MTTLRCWDITTSVPLWQINPVHSHKYIGFSSVSSDERYVIVSNLSTGADLYSLETLQKSQSYTCQVDPRSNVPVSVHFLHDGKQVACGTHTGGIPIWDRKTGSIVQTLQHDVKLVKALAVRSTDNLELLATATTGDEPYIQIWGSRTTDHSRLKLYILKLTRKGFRQISGTTLGIKIALITLVALVAVLLAKESMREFLIETLYIKLVHYLICMAGEMEVVLKMGLSFSKRVLAELSERLRRMVPRVTLKRGLWLSHQKEDEGLKPKRTTRKEAGTESADTPISQSADVEPLALAVHELVLDSTSSAQTVDSKPATQRDIICTVVRGDNKSSLTAQTIVNATATPDSRQGRNTETNYVTHKFTSLEAEFLRRKETLKFPCIQFDSQTDTMIDDPTPPPLSFELNASFLNHRDWVSYALTTLETMGPRLETDGESLTRTRHTNLVTDLKSHESFLKDTIQIAWDQRQYEHKPDMNLPLQYDCSSYSQFFNPDQTLEMPMLFGLITTIVLHLITSLSRPGTNFLLEAMSLIIKATCSKVTQPLESPSDDTPSLSDVINDCHWPFDVRSAIEKFHLDPDLIYYAIVVSTGKSGQLGV
ncbi:hypothetical protein JOM56_010939 [Amanita muscaria]